MLPALLVVCIALQAWTWRRLSRRLGDGTLGRGQAAFRYAVTAFVPVVLFVAGFALLVGIEEALGAAILDERAALLILPLLASWVFTTVAFGLRCLLPRRRATIPSAPAPRSPAREGLMTRPLLKQFGDLTAHDFETHPVWIGSHTADYEEPWYDETDEETFRPRTGDLPAEPSEGMLLVRAVATLADGSTLPAFLTPAFEDGDLGSLQPQVFVAGRMFSFWGGVMGVPEAVRKEFYDALGRTPESVFPIDVAADPAVAGGVARARVEGFYKTARGRAEVQR